MNYIKDILERMPKYLDASELKRGLCLALNLSANRMRADGVLTEPKDEERKARYTIATEIDQQLGDVGYIYELILDPKDREDLEAKALKLRLAWIKRAVAAADTVPFSVTPFTPEEITKVTR